VWCRRGPPRPPRSRSASSRRNAARAAETDVSDGERLTGASAVGPEAGEWLPTFSEAFLPPLTALGARVPAAA
jgi:hypothetical protein